MQKCKTFQIIFLALVVFASAHLFFKSAMASDLNLLQKNWQINRNELEQLEKKQNLELSDIKRRNELLRLEYQSRAIYLQEIASLYIAGNLASQDIDRDFKYQPQYQKYMSHFSAILLQVSIQRLQKSNIPEIKKFMQKYSEVYEINSIPLFRITGAEINRESPTEEKAGFHRGKKSIFMDITRTPANEWLFIFMHELFHALDNELYNAIVEFSNEDLMISIKKISNKKKNLVELTSEEMKKLDQFALAGLNRGLFAEYRAWFFGFSVYESGIAEGLWRKILFVENVLSFREKNESMNDFVYRYLNERSEIHDEFLMRPVIFQKISEKRELFRP